MAHSSVVLRDSADTQGILAEMRRAGFFPLLSDTLRIAVRSKSRRRSSQLLLGSPFPLHSLKHEVCVNRLHPVSSFVLLRRSRPVLRRPSEHRRTCVFVMTLLTGYKLDVFHVRLSSHCCSIQILWISELDTLILKFLFLNQYFVACVPDKETIKELLVVLFFDR